MSRLDLTRNDNDEIRKIEILTNYTKHAEGSVLICMGDTKVICTATVEEKVPPFKKGSGEGWVTAEYSMLPRATQTRNMRDINKLKLNGRAQEIQRLIGRALRSVVDFKLLGERTVTIDCDVIQADGGTRTASINGGFVALALAMNKLVKAKQLSKNPITSFVGAISVGVLNGEVISDLAYVEDSKAKVDMNVVMTDKGEFVEIQGTGEEKPFSENEFIDMISIAKKSITEVIAKQKEALEKNSEGNS